MICYPEIAASTDNCLDHKTIINNIIQVGFLFLKKNVNISFSRNLMENIYVIIETGPVDVTYVVLGYTIDV